MNNISEASAQLKKFCETVTTHKTLAKATFPINTVEELLTTLTRVPIPLPAVGVLYEGSRSIDAPNSGGRQMGLSGEMVFSLVCVMEVNVISNAIDGKTPAQVLLDALRTRISGQKSPDGHFWKWVLEAPFKAQNNKAIWVQRWKTPMNFQQTSIPGQ